MDPLRIDVFSDMICPWCFLGKHQLERAIAEHSSSSLQVHFRPYMLNPDTPPEGVARAEYFKKRFGSNPASLDAAHARLEDLGGQVGIRFAFDRAERIPNTIAAHALARWAAEQHLEATVVERLFTAYFTEGRDIGNHGTLADIAAEAGLDRHEVCGRLARETDFDAVREEADAARTEGITGVPFYIFGERLAVSGAQPPDVLSKVIARAVQPA
jgi:predicted DsbA family dithiol-disulfide isomerase